MLVSCFFVHTFVHTGGLTTYYHPIPPLKYNIDIKSDGPSTTASFVCFFNEEIHQQLGNMFWSIQSKPKDTVVLTSPIWDSENQCREIAQALAATLGAGRGWCVLFCVFWMVLEQEDNAGNPYNLQKTNTLNPRLEVWMIVHFPAVDQDSKYQLLAHLTNHLTKYHVTWTNWLFPKGSFLAYKSSNDWPTGIVSLPWKHDLVMHVPFL